MENPRYTGYAVFGRWTKHETLLDPDDVAAGHVVRFRRYTPDQVVRSASSALEGSGVSDAVAVVAFDPGEGGVA